MFCMIFCSCFLLFMCPAWLRNEKCQKVWFPWQKPSTYGWLLETFHMVLKEKKNWLRFSTFSLSLFLSLYLSISLFQLSMKKLKPWLLRGVLIYLVLLQLIMMTTIAMIKLIKTIAQGTYKFTLICFQTRPRHLIRLKWKWVLLFLTYIHTHLL